MVAHRLGRQRKPARDLGILKAFGEQLQDLRLPGVSSGKAAGTVGVTVAKYRVIRFAIADPKMASPR